MLELRVIPNLHGTWELWVNQTCVTTEFVTKDAAWNYAERYLAQFDKGHELAATDADKQAFDCTHSADSMVGDLANAIEVKRFDAG